MDKIIQTILDHSFEYAKELLEDTGQCYPFGAFVDNAEIVHPFEFEIKDKKNIPNNESVIWSLRKFCETEMEEGRIIAYGITYEAGVQLNEGDDNIETIAIDIILKGGHSVPVYYFPYEIQEPEIVNFGEAFAVKREE